MPDTNRIQRYIDHQLSDLDSELDTINTTINTIELKTDNLPSNPADQSAVETAITAAHTTTNDKIDTIDTVVNTINDKIDIIDGYHDVPNIDNAANSQTRDVIGNKSDTVTGNSLVALIKQIIANLTSGLNRKLSSMDFWSDYADITLDTVDSAKTHANTVIIPTFGVGSIPPGATIYSVHVLFKTRVISNSNAADNAINIATCELQIKKGAAGSYVNAMSIPDNSWFVEKKITWGGDAIEGDENLSATVTEADTYYFQIAHGKVDGNYLTLRDVAWGLRVWWY